MSIASLAFIDNFPIPSLRALSPYIRSLVLCLESGEVGDYCALTELAPVQLWLEMVG